MRATPNRYYLLNYVFVSCVIILALNDHYLKFAFSNWFTGKLSDVAGIIILPLLLAFLFPQLNRVSIVLAAVLFIFWKSPVSEPLIDLYNEYTLIQLSRVVDYSDLLVLVFLTIPYFIMGKMEALEFLKIKKVNPNLVLIPTLLAMMATSPPPSYQYTRTEGNLRCYQCNFNVKYNQDEIVEKLGKLDIKFDSIVPIDEHMLERFPNLKNQNVHFYRINNLIIDKDTLHNLDFTMLTFKKGKTKIYFNGMQVSDDISNYKLEKKLAAYYAEILFRELKNKLKQ